MIPLLFENEVCIIVDKPPLWLSVPARDAKDPRKVLGIELQSQLQTKIFPIHRLDAEVGGIIMYGKTAEFHRQANQLFEKKEIHKTYQAFTDKGPFHKSDKVSWKSKILRGKKRTFEADHGQPSLTEGFVFAESKEHLEWRLNPITGRAHQLRFELTKHQCPIYGDKLYGSQATWPLGIALKAIQLQLPESFASTYDLPNLFTAPLLELPTISGPL